MRTKLVTLLINAFKEEESLRKPQNKSHFLALNVTRYSKTEVFWKQFSILKHWSVLKTLQFFNTLSHIVQASFQSPWGKGMNNPTIFLALTEKIWGEWMVTSRCVDQKRFNVKRTTTHWKLANILQQYWNVKLSIGYKC